MTETINTQRRRMLMYAGATAAAASFPNLLLAGSSVAGNKASPNFKPDIEIELKQEVVQVPIFSGPRTRVWKIYGNVLKGPKEAVKNLPSYLAPTLHLRKGQKVRIFLKNNLPAESILHWHGLHVPADMDGNPMHAINSGQTYVYEFEVMNRAGTYWYHAHTHNVTAEQVYYGLAGLFIVKDDEEQALGLPSGEYDIPIVIQDRTFDDRNQLVYINHMMQRMHGFLGDQILINGRPDFTLPVADRSYRFRLLNGSNSRIYKLAWDDGTPLQVIGVDGGLLGSPETYDYIMLAPGERREIWVDFNGRSKGTELTMRSIPFSASMQGGMMGGGMMNGRRGGMMGGHRGGMMGGGMMGGRRGGIMGGGMMAQNQLPSGGEYPVLKFNVVKKAQDNDSLPKKLAGIKRLRLKDAANAGAPRTISLSMRHMSALLNGRSYKMNDVQPDEIIPLNTLQLIEFDNGYEGGIHGMMGMPHPMHLHGEQFQVVKREVNSAYRSNYETVSKGFVDNGWTDTVLVMPGEKVTLLKPFNDFKGLFMYHCHNLEHEDMGMMRDFLIQ